jgi:hypothetical protein
VSDEFDELLDPEEEAPDEEPSRPVGDLDPTLRMLDPEGPEPPALEPPQLTDSLRETLVTAASLLPSDDDRDQGDYESSDQGTLYKGFRILVLQEDWPEEPLHEHLKNHFYVVSPQGTIGLVPWDGSQIVWPWEAAWKQDLYRSEVTPVLKEPEKKKKP